MTPAVGRAPRGTSAPVIRIKSEEFENSIRVEEDSGRFLAAVLENRQQPGGFAPGPLLHPLPRDPDGCVAGRERVGVPIAVRLEGAAIAVELVAVELDDQPFGVENGVHEVPGDPNVRARPREAVIVAEGQETVLELRPGRPPPRLDERSESGAPGWRGNLATTSVRASLCMYRERRASRTTLLSAGSLSRGATSSTVLAGLVTRIPRCVRTSWRVRAVDRCTRIPGRA